MQHAAGSVESQRSLQGTSDSEGFGTGAQTPPLVLLLCLSQTSPCPFKFHFAVACWVGAGALQHSLHVSDQPLPREHVGFGGVQDMLGEVGHFVLNIILGRSTSQKSGRPTWVVWRA